MSSARASRLLARKDVGVCSVDIVGSREVAISCQARCCVLASDSIAHVSGQGSCFTFVAERRETLANIRGLAM